MTTRIINYKGHIVELGELPEPRKGYWKRRDDDLIHEVECGTWEDLERIAKRSIDATTERQ